MAPMYCYESQSTGQVSDYFFPVGQAPARMVENGEVLTRCYHAERKGFPPTRGWPLECIASGVHASQAGELKKYLRDKGVPTEVSSDGNPIYKNARHRKKALAARGMFDKSGYN